VVGVSAEAAIREPVDRETRAWDTQDVDLLLGVAGSANGSTEGREPPGAGVRARAYGTAWRLLRDEAGKVATGPFGAMPAGA